MNPSFEGYESPKLHAFEVRRVFNRAEKHISLRIGVLFKKEGQTIYRNFYSGQDHPKHIQAFLGKLEADPAYAKAVLTYTAAWQWVDEWYNNLALACMKVADCPSHPHNRINLPAAYRRLKALAVKTTTPARRTDVETQKVPLYQGEVDLGIATLCDFLLHSGVSVTEPTQGHGTHANHRPRGPARVKLNRAQQAAISRLPNYVLAHQVDDFLTFTEDELAQLNDKLLQDYPQRITLAGANAARVFPATLQPVS